jgi:transposase
MISDVYVETEEAFPEVHPHKDVIKVLLHHDNARPSTSVLTGEAIKNLQRTVLPHPPYCPELSPLPYFQSFE